MNVLILLVLALLWSPNGNTQNTIKDPIADRHDIQYTLHYLEDKQSNLTLDDIISESRSFRPFDGDSQNFGFTTSTYWIYIPIDLRDTDIRDWMLEIGYPMLDSISVFQLRQNGQVNDYYGGDDLPFSARQFASRNFVFKLNFENDAKSDIYIRIKSNSSMQIPLKFWKPDEYALKTQSEHLLLGLYYGAMIALLAYNLMLIFTIRDSVYFYYSGYILFYIIFQMSINGLAYKYLWPESPWMADQGLLIFLSLSAVFATKFSHSLLQVRKNMPRQDRLCFLMITFYSSMIPLILVIEYQLMVQVLSLITTFGCFYFIYLAYRALKLGVSTARYYLLAWFNFLFGVTIYALKSQGFVPSMLITEHAIQVGSALEVLLLSFALAHRFKALRDENARIQNKAKELLEQNVEERTRELKTALDNLSVANSRLEYLSNTDSLTGVNNRAFFNSHSDYVWNTCLRNNDFLSFLMIDVDHFKNINDNYGHVIGDEVLIGVAQNIKSSLSRATDQVARYGGEEFVVLLPSTDQKGAVLVAERIRRKIEKFDTTKFGLQSNITVSIGVGTAMPGTSDLCLKDALKHTDDALYKAKRNGRNRIEKFLDGHSGITYLRKNQRHGF